MSVATSSVTTEISGRDRVTSRHLTIANRMAINASVARPLRIEIPGGRYHVTARGNERRDLFRDDRDRLHFLELLGELAERQ